VNAKTLFQCAVDKVVPGGVRVNVIENNGKIRANLIFGTTVSGTMYSVHETSGGYVGAIRNKPQFTLELTLSDTAVENANIRGSLSQLKAVYPTLNNDRGYDVIETELVCGTKITERWN
jgi:hypothetical protein